MLTTTGLVVGTGENADATEVGFSGTGARVSGPKDDNENAEDLQAAEDQHNDGRDYKTDEDEERRFENIVGGVIRQAYKIQGCSVEN